MCASQQNLTSVIVSVPSGGARRSRNKQLGLAGLPCARRGTLTDNGRVAKAPPTEAALATIRSIRDEPEKYDLRRDLAPLLRHKSNHVIAAAADTVGRLEAVALAPDLVDVFGELMKSPSKLDQGCKALTAIAKTLVLLDDPASKVYFAGIRHVQKEASFGPPVDNAASLRGLCAQGLARMSHPEALLECVRLLVDPEVAARSGALRAIGETGQPAAELLLRFKALIGDKDDEVMAECFAALLALAPAQSAAFVAEFLQSQVDGIAERAALALGESRLPAALSLLRRAWEATVEPGIRRTLLVAIAMLRQDDAVEFLVSRIAEDSQNAAVDALTALAPYARDEALRKRITEIVEQRNILSLRAAFEREYRV